MLAYEISVAAGEEGWKEYVMSKTTAQKGDTCEAHVAASNGHVRMAK